MYVFNNCRVTGMSTENPGAIRLINELDKRIGNRPFVRIPDNPLKFDLTKRMAGYSKYCNKKYNEFHYHLRT